MFFTAGAPHENESHLSTHSVQFMAQMWHNDITEQKHRSRFKRGHITPEQAPPLTTTHERHSVIFSHVLFSLLCIVRKKYWRCVQERWDEASLYVRLVSMTTVSVWWTLPFSLDGRLLQQTLAPHWKQLKQTPHGGGAYIYTVTVDRSQEVWLTPPK